jgi:ABC-type antimicrobial peptide transport system permease subunit
MTVGGTTATFAQAVHARRRTVGIHRATGATPWGVLRRVLRDAVLVGSVAALLATLLAQLGLLALSRLGYLTVFGVRLSPVLEPTVLLGCLVAAVGVTVLGATLATVGLLTVAPGALLSEVSVSAETPTNGLTADGGERRE